MPKALRRTVYRDQLPPHNVRPGPATRAEIALDAENYYEPLIQALATAHAPGVVSGLAVLMTVGSRDLVVSPGVAVDALGRVIVLSDSGRAEIGSNADAPNARPELVSVTTNGVPFPTAGLTGDLLLLIRWWETFDEEAFSDTGVLRIEHTPWIQAVSFGSLEEAERLANDKTRIALALVQCGAGADAGKVTGSLPIAQPRIKLDQALEVRRLALQGDDPLKVEKVGTLAALYGNVGALKLSVLDPGLVIEARQVQIDGDLEVTGAATFRGRKTGFVADAFCNATGQRLECGDLIVLNSQVPTLTPGSGIPVPHVEIATHAYDRRVCGVVSDGAEPGGHGHMVTLGCWAHCKVDADISAVETGDLLTSSPTPGHAQKVLEPGRALGAVLGKALAPLTSGKGVIPVLVSLH